jgi:hypothetical protein
VAHSEIDKVMLCLCHTENTVDKEIWRQQNTVQIPSLSSYREILNDLGYVLR